MTSSSSKRKLIVWFEEVSSKDTDIAGGKGANLGELVTIGVPVPPGFIVTTEAYKYFMEKTGLKKVVLDILSKIDVNNKEELERASREIRRLIEETPVPAELEEEIVKAYRELSHRIGVENPRVAVRSSASAEDLPDASFAGQQETFLNVIGEKDVVNRVRACWASVFTARAIFYREQHGISHERVAGAVVVQKMVNSRSSGVLFTIHPVTGDPNLIVIEAGWGLGEAVARGMITPDKYVIDKRNLRIVEKEISTKEKMMIYDEDKKTNVVVEVPQDYKRKPSISDEEALSLAKFAIKIENHYKNPMDIEWAIDRDIEPPNNIFIVQARYETVWSRKAVKKAPSEARVLVRGLPASPGVATGIVKVIIDPKSPEAAEFKEGNILVTRMTDPDWVPLMKKAAAIVTDEGGMTSHAAIVSRELGIPAVVGTRNATKVLRDVHLVTVDGSKGIVYEGEVEIIKKTETGVEEKVSSIDIELLQNLYPITATQIYMNLGEPDAIDKYANLPFDGIGLMRIEFIISDRIGYHPVYLIDNGKGELFVEGLVDGISKVASTIYPRPVVVRFSDFRTNEFKGLKGGEKYEVDERNPMIGWRGAARYIHEAYEKAFRLELEAIRRVREELGLKNVWVMIPFVRTTWELEKVLEIMASEGLRSSRDFKIWIMAEVPSVAILAEEFAKYIDGFSIGSNDLTQLVLGVDRDSQLLADMGYFDERDPAVLKAIKMIVDGAHKYGKTVSICGQAPSVYPELVEYLVRIGIDSISVNPDAVIATRRLVARIERKILLEKSK